jgi:hypothetical protein
LELDGSELLHLGTDRSSSPSAAAVEHQVGQTSWGGAHKAVFSNFRASVGDTQIVSPKASALFCLRILFGDSFCDTERDALHTILVKNRGENKSAAASPKNTRPESIQKRRLQNLFYAIQLPPAAHPVSRSFRVVAALCK